MTAEDFFYRLQVAEDGALDVLDDIAAGALAAGCDVVLYCNATLEDRTRVADAAGEMSDAAQTRAARALAMRRTPDDVDIPALTAKLDRLLGGTVYG